MFATVVVMVSTCLLFFDWALVASVSVFLFNGLLFSSLVGRIGIGFVDYRSVDTMFHRALSK